MTENLRPAVGGQLLELHSSADVHLGWKGLRPGYIITAQVYLHTHCIRVQSASIHTQTKYYRVKISVVLSTTTTAEQH